MPGSSLRPSRGECPVAPRWASRQLPPRSDDSSRALTPPVPGFRICSPDRARSRGAENRHFPLLPTVLSSVCILGCGRGSRAPGPSVPVTTEMTDGLGGGG